MKKKNTNKKFDFWTKLFSLIVVSFFDTNTIADKSAGHHVNLSYPAHCSEYNCKRESIDGQSILLPQVVK